MKPRPRFELPDEVRQTLRRAARVQWLSLILMISCVIVVYFTLGQSEAMKAIWVEDLLAVIPPAAYLISDRVRWREPTKRYPYGYLHAVSIGFVTSAMVLLILGVLIFLDALRTLLTREHPTIGMVGIFGKQIWLGWLMIPALVYTIACEFGVARLKKPLATKLHDKTLAADARMNRADWMTGATGIVGVTGIAFGWWWADAVAALVIATEIVRDGAENLKDAVADLMDEVPTQADEGESAEWAGKLRARVSQLDWVRDVDVRLREEGNVFTGEVFVVPKTTDGFAARAAELQRVAREVDWRFYDLALVAVERL